MPHDDRYDYAFHVVQWVAKTFGSRAGLSCSFGGPGGIVLAHMVARCTPKIPVLFLDTDFLFARTYALKQRLQKEWGLTIRTGRPDLTPDEQTRTYGPDLWTTDPDLCCTVRKVEPMNRLLNDVDCWMTGLRRDQSPTRRNVNVYETHPLSSGRVIIKVNPLALWTRRDVWTYVHRHRLPYNDLLNRGYTSLGCTHCTVPASGADERSGRWQNTSKTECGLHR